MPPGYKHVAPLGLNASRLPVLNPANPSILSVLIQTTNALRNQPNRDTIFRPTLSKEPIHHESHNNPISTPANCHRIW